MPNDQHLAEAKRLFGDLLSDPEDSATLALIASRLPQIQRSQQEAQRQAAAPAPADDADADRFAKRHPHTRDGRRAERLAAFMGEIVAGRQPSVKK